MADPALTPASELRAAAAKLREMAAATAGGEWTAEYLDNHNVWWVNHETHDGDWVTHGTVAELDSVGMAGNAAWIALMGPDKADALADLLDEAGNLAHFADVMAGGSESSLSISERAALRFARSILGSS